MQGMRVPLVNLVSGQGAVPVVTRLPWAGAVSAPDSRLARVGLLRLHIQPLYLVSPARVNLLHDQKLPSIHFKSRHW
jgi:hypothetical protein